MQDGQTESNVSLWRKRLREAQPEVLSVCASIEESCRREDLILTESKRLLGVPAASVERILEGIDAFMRRMPRVDGFFASEEEQRAAFWNACHLLTSLEAAANALREQTGRLSQMREQLRKDLLMLSQNESVLWHILQAAEQEKADRLLEGARQIMQKNKQTRQDVLRFEAIFGEAYRIFAEDAEARLRAFCTEIAEAADLDHAGKACAPRRVIQSLEEYKSALLTALSEGRELLKRLEKT